ncbi:MAG: N-acetyl-gamma-glutamyl-phosphate reductase [Nitrospira sp.]|nr:N-acetyl-gamma-glutamyl-phosphate reductase [Nitrospira sp.]
MDKKFRVAIAGASGYAGAELVRLAAAHPHFTITAVTSEKSAGQPIASVFPSLRGMIEHRFEALAPDALAERADAVFLALPHTKSQDPVAVCVKAGKPVVDLSADYRLKQIAAYEEWYQTSHAHPHLLQEAVYGLPELHRNTIAKSRLVASPGCYPTAAILQLAPLFSRGLVQPETIVIDAKSGVSGAGRSPALAYHFPEAHESLEPYKIGQHRHTPEIEQELSRLHALSGLKEKLTTVIVTFTPHLVPMNRGILSTAYCKLVRTMPLPDLRDLYREFYKGERFVRLCEDVVPNPRYIRGTNYCDVGVYADSRAGWVVTVAAIDNLVKGAAGQAIQAMNLMLGIAEETGLTAPASYP